MSDDDELEDLDLGADEEPIDFWANKQKELVTSVVDYNLNTISDLIDDETIDLDPKYQRRLRWDSGRQSRLIESFLMNVPVPPVYLNEDEYGKYSVIDGKQRLNSIRQFLTNNLALEGLKVFADINGAKLNDLAPRLRSIIRTRPTIRAIIILRQSDADIKYEVFQRLNTGGAKLNAQEIRNNAFHGSLNKMIMDLSGSKPFHAALGIRSKEKSAIYHEMRDAELILRFFTFRESWPNFAGGVRRAMDTFMDNNRNLPRPALDQMDADFMKTLGVVVEIFGENAFRRWLPGRHLWRKQPVASIFDAQMFSCQSYLPGQLLPFRLQIVEDFKGLFADDEFRQAIDAATNTPALFKKRIEMTAEILDKYAR